MPVSLKHLKNQRRPLKIDFDFGDGIIETLNVVYNPGVLTDEMIEQATNDDTLRNEEQLNQMLALFVVQWDLVDEGEPIPLREALKEGAPLPKVGTMPTPSAELAGVPIIFKASIVAEVMKDATANPTTNAGASGAISARGGK